MMNSADLDRLRADVIDAGQFPDLADIERRGRARIGRHRTVGVAAVALVVAVAVAGGSFFGLSRGKQVAPTGGNLLAGAVAGPLAGTEVLLNGPIQALQYLPVDSREQFAVVMSGNRRIALARTLDGGRSWKAWEMPAGAGTGDPATGMVTAPGSPVGVSLQVISRTTVLFGDFVSRDAGQTWNALGTAGRLVGNTSSWQDDTSIRITTAVAVNSVPPGWQLRQFCAGSGEICKLYAVDPVGLGWHPLTQQPGGVQRIVGLNAITAMDGTSWAVRTYEPGEGLCTINHSSDRGASWSTYSIPAADGCTYGPPTTTKAGVTYALLMGATANNGLRSTALLVSRDGGKTWSKTPLNVALDQLAALPDGTLLGVRDKGGSLMLSNDGGKSFTAIPGTEHSTGLIQTVTGAYTVAIEGANSRNNTRLSEDGKHWAQIRAVPGQK
jgi:photosystem II stability/assembly factor-like uncharacterized protein